MDPHHSPRDNHFNLLRLSLAAGVLLSHCFSLSGFSKLAEPWVAFTGGPRTLGTVCVEGFFILSGYLVSESFQRSPNLPTYLTARGLRIYPAAIVAALIVGLLLGPLVSTLAPLAYFQSAGLQHFLYAATTFLDLNAKDYVEGVFASNPVVNRLNAPLWTISWELLCYALLIPVGILLYRQPKVWLRRAAFAGLCLLTIPGAIQYALRPLPNDHFAGLLVFWMFFSVGMLGRQVLPRLPQSAALTAVAFIAFLGLNYVERYAPVIGMAGPFLFGYVLLTAATRLPRSWLAYNRLGDFWYGTYLYAWPIQQTVVLLLPGIGPWKLFLLALPITLVAAALSWHWLERPALRLKARLGNVRRGSTPRVTARVSPASGF